MAVSIVRYQGSDSLKKAVDLCDGFSNLKPASQVLIKPNIVMGGRRSQVPYGWVVTPMIMGDLVTLLREYGCKNIVIAEGSAIQKELGLNTARALEWSGIGQLAAELEVPLLDLNEGPFTTVEIAGKQIEIASRVLEADFVINLPVLKTHQLTKTSMGLKNMKGTLSNNSKRLCHEENLEYFIAGINTKLHNDLTIIDGIWGLQKGPIGNDHHRLDLIIAGKEIMEVDAVGAAVVGIDPQSIVYLQLYALMMNQELKIENIEIKGEKILNVRKKLEWVTDWVPELFANYQIKGVVMETPFYSNCSGCGMGIFVGLNNFFRECPGATFKGVEICAGREPVATTEAKKAFLLGKCAINTNKNHPRAIRVPGCPPSPQKIYETLKKELELQ